MVKRPVFRYLMFGKIVLLFLIGFQSLSGVSLAGAEPKCMIPGSSSPCINLVSGLPWQFTVVERSEQNHRILFKSEKPVNQSGLYLKMSLDIVDYDNHEAAVETFFQTCRKADPDMGISYAWDLVTVRDKRLFHLHAACTLAERHFESLVKSLEQVVPATDQSSSLTLLCRCGGGCRQVEDNRDKDEKQN